MPQGSSPRHVEPGAGATGGGESMQQGGAIGRPVVPIPAPMSLTCRTPSKSVILDEIRWADCSAVSRLLLWKHNYSVYGRRKLWKAARRRVRHRRVLTPHHRLEGYATDDHPARARRSELAAWTRRGTDLTRLVVRPCGAGWASARKAGCVSSIPRASGPSMRGVRGTWPRSTA